MSNKQKLQKIINESGLDTNDKAEWDKIMELSTDELIKIYAQIFSKFPNELEWFSGIIRRKKEAYREFVQNAERGKLLLNIIYVEEKNKLKELVLKA